MVEGEFVVFLWGWWREVECVLIRRNDDSHNVGLGQADASVNWNSEVWREEM